MQSLTASLYCFRARWQSALMAKTVRRGQSCLEAAHQPWGGLRADLGVGGGAAFSRSQQGWPLCSGNPPIGVEGRGDGPAPSAAAGAQEPGLQHSTA